MRERWLFVLWVWFVVGFGGVAVPSNAQTAADREAGDNGEQIRANYFNRQHEIEKGIALKRDDPTAFSHLVQSALESPKRLVRGQGERLAILSRPFPRPQVAELPASFRNLMAQDGRDPLDGPPFRRAAGEMWLRDLPKTAQLPRWEERKIELALYPDGTFLMCVMHQTVEKLTSFDSESRRVIRDQWTFINGYIALGTFARIYPPEAAGVRAVPVRRHEVWGTLSGVLTFYDLPGFPELRGRSLLLGVAWHPFPIFGE